MLIKSHVMETEQPGPANTAISSSFGDRKMFRRANKNHPQSNTKNLYPEIRAQKEADARGIGNERLSQINGNGLNHSVSNQANIADNRKAIPTELIKEGPGDYTYEDYIKDFELDYLGFDGVPPDSVSNLYPENISENELETENNDIDEDIHK